MPLTNPELWERILDSEVLLTPLVSSPPPFAMDPTKWVTRLDFTVAAKCALTNAQAEEAKGEYLAFLYLAFVTDDLIAPSEVVAIFWHTHMDDHASYNEFCMAHFDRVIRHSTARPLPYDDAAYALTLARYQQEFDESPPIWFWPRQSISGFDWRLSWVAGLIILLIVLGISADSKLLLSMAGVSTFLTLGIAILTGPVSTTYQGDDLPPGFPADFGHFTCNGGGCAAD